MKQLDLFSVLEDKPKKIRIISTRGKAAQEKKRLEEEQEKKANYELGIKMYKSLNLHQRINIKCHQTLHIYTLYPSLLRDDLNDGVFRFEDRSRFDGSIRSTISLTRCKHPYSTYII